MTISARASEAMRRSSWVRRMFETGREMKRRLGPDNVYDLSLGNPLTEPPEKFTEALRELTRNPPPGAHRYMPNAGFLGTRRAVAAQVAVEQGRDIAADDIVMTVGAAGALNIALRALTDPGDEVIVLAPYFVEYLFYIDNHGASATVVETNERFSIDCSAIDSALRDRTRAVIVNTPNNPTGRVYSADEIGQLGETLRRHEKRTGNSVYLIFDTPYAGITYEGHKNPPLLDVHPHTLVAHSYSKELGLAGERIGYLVINPAAPARQNLRDACTFANRVLGYVNAPALMQLAIERSLPAPVDDSLYALNRRQLCEVLDKLGYDFARPEGAFFAFPRCPIEDDLAFTEILRQHNVLVVPGRGFGRPGHVRIAFCVSQATMQGATRALAQATQAARASGSGAQST